MKQDNSKQRLFEVMARLDKTFKSNLNEEQEKDNQYFQNKINNNEVWLEYYPPSNSEEYTDGNIWYNRSGQTLRNPDQYRNDTEGHTPFGDEG